MEMGAGHGTSIDILAAILKELSPRLPPDICTHDTEETHVPSSDSTNHESSTSVDSGRHPLRLSVREELYDDGSRGMEVDLSLNDDGSLGGEACLWSGDG